MAWVELRTGHWQRPIGENETMIKAIGATGEHLGRDVWSISITASFHFEPRAQGPVLSEKLRDGWKALRFRHPSIAAVVVGGSLEYDVPDISGLEDWANETFVTVPGETSPANVIAGLAPRRFATLFHLVEDSSIILYMSHWRTDAIGSFHLLNEYFQLVLDTTENNPDKLAWGDETLRLVPSVEVALGNPQSPSPAVQEAVNRFLGTLAYNFGALQAPYNAGPNITPGDTRIVDLRLTHDETRLVQAQCQELRVSLEAAVHASVTAAAYSLAEPSSKNRHHTSTLRHSLRPHLPEPYDGVAGAAGLYTAGYMVKVPGSQSWMDNAKQYESEYRKGATPDLLSSRRQYATVMTDILRDMPVPHPPPSGLDISWVPDVQSLVSPSHATSSESLEVFDVGISVQVLSRHVYVFGWVFRDQLALRVIHNDSFFDGNFGGKVLDLVKKQLMTNLLDSTVR